MTQVTKEEYEKGRAKKLYDEGIEARSGYIDRGKLVAAVTTPSLSPTELKYKSGELHYTSQGLGAYGINNLSSKLLLALFPANFPFFRLTPTKKIKDEAEAIAQQKGEPKGSVLADIEKALSSQEKIILDDIAESGDRVKIFMALKQFLVNGNALLDTLDNKLRMFTLPHYVVKRDCMGNILYIVIHEKVAPSVLEASAPKVYEQLKIDPAKKTIIDKDEEISIYTLSERKKDQWVDYQEVEGIKIEGTEGKYPLDAPRFIPIAPYRIDGEDYGRSYIEEFVGDLITLEYLTKAIKQGAEAAARFLLFVNPNGTTILEDVEDADNGETLVGSADDVTTLQIGKASDFRVAKETIDAIEQRLNRAFLLNSTVQRQAERVTAEEVKFMAGELEDGMGGLYSILAEDFQRPYISRKINYKQRKGQLPQLPAGTTKIAIVTGVEALGRGADRTKLVGFIKTLFDTMGETALQSINKRELTKRLAVADGIDIDGLFITEAQEQAETQNTQMQEMAGKVAPEAIRQMGGMAQMQMQNELNQQPPTEGQ